MRYIFLLLSFSVSTMIYGQDKLFKDYEMYREKTITRHRFDQQTILPLINSWKESGFYKVNKVGASLEERPIYLLSAGSGPVSILLWSQMHGDESTATMALFDIFQYLYKNRQKPEVSDLLNRVTLHFIPMLNPDGAQHFRRRNAQHIDINRDALRLQTPEGQTLKQVRDSLEPDFGFNLHDQSRYYNVEGSPATATLSFLAPAWNQEKSIDTVRRRAMQVIVAMNEAIQKYAPGRVGRYSDDFEPRAFGDNIQKWGTSTILIESGGYPDDPEKQYIRKLNYVAILTALYAIADQSYETADMDLYEQIPKNDRQLVGLKITSALHTTRDIEYVIDLGFSHSLIGDSTDTGFHYKAELEDLGDLSTWFGYQTLDASGMKIIKAEVYPQTMDDLEQVSALDYRQLLKEGYAWVRIDLDHPGGVSPVPLNILTADAKPVTELTTGVNPAFFLEKDGVLVYAVINGFLISLEGNESNAQGLIFNK